MCEEIDYFTIEGTPGGNQEWCLDFWMYLGGCGALAACDLSICLARNYQLAKCCPCDAFHMLKKDYVDFSMKMKPYIHPRMGGVTKLSMFTDGCGQYLRDCGYQAEFITCSGDKSYENAKEFVRKAISRNLPVAYLMLRHRDKKFKDLNWHWFSVTGYKIKDGSFFLIYHTYGEKSEVDFERLWNTGMYRKGGMISLSKISELSEKMK